MKLIYIDVETTGIPCPQSGLIQLADAIEIDAAKPVFFQYDIQPFPTDEIVEEALQVNGITREAMAAFTEPAAAYSKFISLLNTYIDKYNRSDKFHFIGYNAMFDSGHVRSWFEKNGNIYYGSYFFHPPIDVMGMAAVHLMEQRADMQDFKLLTVARKLGLKVDETKLHDAKYDIALTRKMFQVLSKREGG